MQRTPRRTGREGRKSERKEGKGRGWRRTHPLPWATTPGRGRGAPAHAPPEGRGGKGGRVRKKGREGTWLASHAPSAMGHHSRQRTWSTSTRTPRRTEREGRKSQKERKGRDVAGVARTLCHGPPLQAKDVEHQPHAPPEGRGGKGGRVRKKGREGTWLASHAPSAMGHHSRQRTWSTSTRTPRRTEREGRKRRRGDGREHGHPLCF